MKYLRGLTVFLFLVALQAAAQDQPAFFVDGYHGGINAHYPNGTTRDIVNALGQHPEWKLSMEIEPVTWESERRNDPQALQEFTRIIADTPDRVEFVSGAYGQPNFLNSDGESLIRQLQMGAEEIHKYFPSVAITTYAAQEPSWTSCMPQILLSLGYQRAVLKNSTCWGGYCVPGKDVEVLNWIGPEGSSIPAVPRYSFEKNNDNCWEMQSGYNQPAYIQGARAAGILHPVGVFFQDAGWKARPWGTKTKPTVNVTWREYFEKVAGAPKVDWRVKQEDFRLGLVWGAQVLQQVAQNVRTAESKLVLTEKIAALAGWETGQPWPEADLRDAWQGLLLAQHHDGWIVPYNKGRMPKTWAERVAEQWIPNAKQHCDKILTGAMAQLAVGSVSAEPQRSARVVNSVSATRQELVSLPWGGANARVLNDQNREVPSQKSGTNLLFLAEVPSLGYTTYHVEPSVKTSVAANPHVAQQADGAVLIETDLYRIALDPAKGGCFTSLYDKTLKREFVEAGSQRKFNEYRGFSTSAGGWISSTDSPSQIQVVEDGPLRIVVTARGKIGPHPFASTLTLTEGQKRIDFQVRIDWQGAPLIGQPWDGSEVKRSMVKPFYDDRYKMQAVFPLVGLNVLYKNAPFDVCQSQNADTLYNDWREIKHNLITHWVDLTDAAGAYGVALMSDHTTSYAYGPSDPLGLVLAYAGKGLWNRDYTITGPTEVRYALLPHGGSWTQAQLWREDYSWREPLQAAWMTGTPDSKTPAKSFVRTAPGTYVTTLLEEKSDLLVRIFNAEGDAEPQEVAFSFTPAEAKLVELNGRVIAPLEITPTGRAGSSITLSVPRFGVRTLRLSRPR